MILQDDIHIFIHHSSCHTKDLFIYSYFQNVNKFQFFELYIPLPIEIEYNKKYFIPSNRIKKWLVKLLLSIDVSSNMADILARLYTRIQQRILLYNNIIIIVDKQITETILNKKKKNLKTDTKTFSSIQPPTSNAASYD